MLKKRLIWLGLILVFCLVGQWVLSASQPAEPNLPQTAQPVWLEQKPSSQSQNLDNLHQNLVRQLLIMILIVAIFGSGLWWFVRKYSKGLLVGKGRLITVVETVPLGPRKMLHLVEVGRKKLLLSSTPDSIRFLAELTETSLPTSPQKEPSL
ncbi:MAG TPA: flagellar biosynthetic protein FliO [Anaerohalosphaeraceae bacterium]|nr:flagellar biosynthetic protein FliO [Anaerohalosphaeraceae bacterium]HOL87652.1 flagellar biosynthetic protein FliO [Anaerohalosphaeraceae bacterium]HPP55841.1 flagellar biosynthetic protein FliO [Anaerohalosphaeraceae bacterium]